MSKNNVQKTYQQVLRKVIRGHRKRFIYFIVNQIYSSFAVLAFIVLLLVGINLLFNVALAIRLIFFLGLLIWFTILIFTRIVPAFKEVISPSENRIYETTTIYGIQEKKIKDLLTNYLQIYRQGHERSSLVLKEKALNQLSLKIFPEVQNIKPIREKIGRKLYLLIFSVLTILLLCFFFPFQAVFAIEKVLVPWNNFKEELPTSLINQSGNLSVLKNDPIVLRGTFEGLKPGAVYVVLEDSIDKEIDNSRKNSNKFKMPISASGQFIYELSHVRKSFKYYFLGEINHPRFRDVYAQSDEGFVIVKDRPLIRSLQIKLTPPAYSGLPAQILSPNEGNVTALKGSRLHLRVESDRLLSGAKVKFSDSTSQDLKIRGHVADGEFVISHLLNYQVEIFDTEHLANYDPVEYNIYVLPDEYPYAEFKQPGADVDLEDQLIVPTLLELRDDYGFTKLMMKGKIIRAATTGDTNTFEFRLPFQVLEKGKSFSEFTWDLTSFYMIPDDYIRYYAEIWDNDVISGPKSFKTKAFTIRLPSLLEILAKGDKTQEENLEDIKETADNSKEIKEKLEEINRELKKETNLEWERKKEIEEQIEKQKDTFEKLSDIQKELENLVENYDQRNLLSPETLEKYMELQKMLDEMTSPQLKEALEKLQEAVQNADLKQVQQALERMQYSMDQFEKNIERTYELLKRVQLEQKFDELVRLAEKLTEAQNVVNEKLRKDNLTEEALENLSNREKNIQQNEEYLKDQIVETQKDYEELIYEPSKMLDRAGSFINNERMNEKIQKMMNQLKSGQQSQATKAGQNLQSQMETLQSMLEMARQEMINQQKMQVTEELQKSIQDMLTTSFQQEEILNKTQKLSSASPQINNVAKKQSGLQENTKQLIAQLIELSKKTFFISPEMNVILSNIMSNMKNSIGHLENRNLKQAASGQRQAMAGFNQVLLSLQGSMSQLSQSSSSSGFQEFMQQLQNMAGQQGQLNQESLSLFQKGLQGRLQLSSDNLARLAAQQEMIRQSLNNLTNKMGERRDVLGRLNEVGEEMEEVINELKAQKIDRKVIERQEKILSRLLDAQKSIRKKEHSRKRKAEYEKQQLIKTPPELRKDLLRREDWLRKELLEALEEGYTQEYRELIKKYFESLYEESQRFQ